MQISCENAISCICDLQKNSYIHISKQDLHTCIAICTNLPCRSSEINIRSQISKKAFFSHRPTEKMSVISLAISLRNPF